MCLVQDIPACFLLEFLRRLFIFPISPPTPTCDWVSKMIYDSLCSYSLSLSIQDCNVSRNRRCCWRSSLRKSLMQFELLNVNLLSTRIQSYRREKDSRCIDRCCSHSNILTMITFRFLIQLMRIKRRAIDKTSIALSWWYIFDVHDTNMYTERKRRGQGRILFPFPYASIPLHRHSFYDIFPHQPFCAQFLIISNH